MVKAVFYDEVGCREGLGPSRGALDQGPFTLLKLHSHPFSNPLKSQSLRSVVTEFRDMWHELETPPLHTLPQELQEAGLTSSTQAVVTPRPAQKKAKKKGRGAKVKITNTHLKDLGIDLSKDYVAPNAGKKP